VLVKRLILPAGSARKNSLFCSKFCSDTIIYSAQILLGIQTVFGPSGCIYFANIGGSLGLTAKNELDIHYAQRKLL